MTASLTAQQWALHYIIHIQSTSAIHTNITLQPTSTRAMSLLHSGLQTEMHAPAHQTTALLILLDPISKHETNLAAVWLPQNYMAKKIFYANINHTVTFSDGAGVLYTDDALCREKVDVNLWVLLFRHENFTMNRFTTWRSAMKTLRREKERGSRVGGRTGSDKIIGKEGGGLLHSETVCLGKSQEAF